MLCEHPGCTSEASQICDRHCHLSLCRQHCLEHETHFLKQFKDQIDQLRQPVSHLLNRTRDELEASEECRRSELKRINEIFDQYLSMINRRSQLSKKAQDFIPKKRAEIIKYKSGDEQLTREKHEELENFYKHLQENLQDQYALTQLLNDKNQPIDSSSTIYHNASNDIDCIELSDSDDEQSETPMECETSDEQNTSISPAKEILIVRKTNVPWNSSDLCRYRDICPITEFGVFGLKESHNIPRLCSKINRERCLYGHFIQTHRIISSIASQLVKAMAAGADPMKTIIFPNDGSIVVKDEFTCPLNTTSLNKIGVDVDIPHTPCYAKLHDLNFKYHLTHTHELSKDDAATMHRAMKNFGTIDHIEWSFE